VVGYATQHRIHATLRKAINDDISREPLIDTNPAKLVDLRSGRHVRRSSHTCPRCGLCGAGRSVSRRGTGSSTGGCARVRTVHAFLDLLSAGEPPGQLFGHGRRVAGLRSRCSPGGCRRGSDSSMRGSRTELVGRQDDRDDIRGLPRWNTSKVSSSARPTAVSTSTHGVGCRRRVTGCMTGS
jgi:hypothetical protein